MAEQHADMLDERMVAARNRAFRTAYYSLGGVITVGLLFAGLFGESVWDGSTVTLDTAAFTGAALLTIVVGMYLPAAILAWTEDVI